MLALLRSRGKVSRQELAQELEVSLRAVSRYKEDLELAGVHIKETRGKHGGYELAGKDYLLALELSQEEEKAIHMALNHLKKEQSFLYQKEFQSAVVKINAIEQNEINNVLDVDFMCKTNQLRCDYEEERNKWNILNDARIGYYKIKMKYMNTNGEFSLRVIHPYGLYVYNGAHYVVAFCQKRKDIRQFKLLRMKEIQLTKEKFEMDKAFKLDDYLSNSIGIYKDETIHVKLKVLYPYAQFFKENQWMDNEKIQDYYDDGYLIYQASMEGKTQIISWILYMGENCIVLEPPELKELIMKTYNNCIKNY